MKTPTGTVLLSAFLILSPCIAMADAALERRIAKYAPICDDYERAKQHLECHRPPGSYKHAYEMTGQARERALAQGRKLLRMRKDTDEAMNRLGR